MKYKRTISLSLALAASLLVGSPTYAGDASGKWAWTIETPDGNSIKSMMTSKQDGTKLTGYLTSAGSDNQLKLQKGTVDENEISFTVVPNFNGGDITVEYSGKLKGDKIDGVLRVVEFDAELEWHAKRQQEDIDPSGDWDWALTTPNGNRLEASLELVVKKGKLLGEIISDNWAMELEEAKISGNKISFKTTNANSDQKYASIGTIKGNKISGTVSFTNDNGEPTELQWTAKRR